MNTETIEKAAAMAYTNYCEAVGGVAFNGDKLPTWEEFSSDPAKAKQADGWRAAALAAGLVYDTSLEPETDFGEDSDPQKVVLAAIRQMRGSERGEAALGRFFRLVDDGGYGLDGYNWKALVELSEFCRQYGSGGCRVLLELLRPVFANRRVSV